MKKILYWIVSLTWGGLMTFIGLIIALVLLITGHKPYKFGYTFYFKVGKSWGGLELGGLFITDSNPSLHTLCHEHGHGLQNLWWGPLFPFVIGIPSAIRYWYREIKYHRKGKVPPTTYDSIWFEGQASRLGEKYFK
jgi:hypothetical protein